VSAVLHTLLAELRSDPVALAELRDLLGAGPAVHTTATLATQLDVTPRTIRAAIERGDLEARRSGRGYVIAAGAVAEWAAPRSAPRPGRAPARDRRLMRDAMARQVR
jgi:excisionase family DNA binding protein